MDLVRHVETFTGFAAKHLTGDTEHDYHIRLKRDHSLRVLENGQAIVAGEALAGRDADLASLACLYHDIGRFPQFARYGTYKDIDSTNHGRLGVLTLRELNLPAEISPADWQLIRAAVGLHNVKEINQRTNGTLRTMVDIVRDADKLDIYGVILDHLSDMDNPNKTVIHSLEVHPTKFSRPVLDTVLAGEVCGYDTLKYSNDFIILLIGWIFSLTHTTSIAALNERGYHKRAFSLLPGNEGIRALKDKVNAFMHYKTHKPS